MTKLILLSLLFELGWLAIVYWGDIAVLPVIIITGLLYQTQLRYRRHHLHFILSGIGLGIVVDSLLIHSGLIALPRTILPPFWLIGLWCIFSMFIVTILPKLIVRKKLFIVFCSIGGTLSYIAGVALSQATFGYTLPYVITILATLWVIIGMVLHWLYQHIILSNTLQQS